MLEVRCDSDVREDLQTTGDDVLFETGRGGGCLVAGWLGQVARGKCLQCGSLDCGARIRAQARLGMETSGVWGVGCVRNGALMGRCALMVGGVCVVARQCMVQMVRSGRVHVDPDKLRL